MYETPKVVEIGDLHRMTLAGEGSGDDDQIVWMQDGVVKEVIAQWGPTS